MAQKEISETEELKAQLKTLRDDVVALTGLLREIGESTAGDFSETIKSKMEDVSRRSAEARDKARERTREQVGALEHQIAEKPIQSALIAFLVGAVLGGMIRR